MIDIAHAVSLPGSTLTTTPQSRPSHTFPNLKIKFTPHASVPAELAPARPRNKGLEDNFKVVVPVGGKVRISWAVDTTGLDKLELLSSEVNTALEDAVGAWLLSNMDALGINRHRWAKSETGDALSTELVLTPSTSMPSQSPLVNHVVPKGEPVVTLQKIELGLYWTMPKSKGKRAAGEMQVGEQPSNPESPQDEVEDDIDDEGEGEESVETTKSDNAAEPLSVSEEALGQISRAMKTIIRAEMIRRFPLIFDGAFAEVQKRGTQADATTAVRAISTSVSEFLFISRKFNTPHGRVTRADLDETADMRANALKAKVKTMARLPVKVTGRKRAKPEGPQPESPDSGDKEEEDKQVERMAGYLERLRLEDEDETESAKAHRTLAEDFSCLTFAKWIQARGSRGKHSALKVELNDASAYDDSDRPSRLSPSPRETQQEQEESSSPAAPAYQFQPSLPMPMVSESQFQHSLAMSLLPVPHSLANDHSSDTLLHEPHTYGYYDYRGTTDDEDDYEDDLDDDWEDDDDYQDDIQSLLGGTFPQPRASYTVPFDFTPECPSPPDNDSLEDLDSDDELDEVIDARVDYAASMAFQRSPKLPPQALEDDMDDDLDDPEHCSPVLLCPMPAFNGLQDTHHVVPLLELPTSAEIDDIGIDFDHIAPARSDSQAAPLSLPATADIDDLDDLDDFDDLYVGNSPECEMPGHHTCHYDPLTAYETAQPGDSYIDDLGSDID